MTGLRSLVLPLVRHTAVWLVFVVCGCAERSPEKEFAANPGLAFEVAEKCTSGPGGPTTAHAIQWPAECVAAYAVVEDYYDTDYYRRNPDEALNQLESCRLADALHAGLLHDPCAAAEEVVLEAYSLDYFLEHQAEAKEQVRLCKSKQQGRRWLEYFPDICANAGEAVYGVPIGTFTFSFHSQERIEKQSKEVLRDLEWAPVRAARDSE